MQNGKLALLGLCALLLLGGCCCMMSGLGEGEYDGYSDDYYYDYEGGVGGAEASGTASDALGAGVR